jgi:Putative beta-barrel porin-2, OmpL-like. bbp2
MRIRRSVCSRASAMVAGTLLTASIAAPAAAQELVAGGLQVAVANAAAATSSPGADPQAPAEPAKPGDQAPATPPPPTPAEIAAKQDSATMSFFRDVELSGVVDPYYAYNFNKPTKPCGTVGSVKIFNCLQNFAVAHNSFGLNLAEVAMEKKPTDSSRGGFRIDLDYGTAAAMVGGTEPTGSPIYQTIQQAYLSYLAPTKGALQFDIGKFVTPFGNEVIESKDNWNYSRSLLFSLAIPYYHEGVRVTYSPNDKVTVAGFLVNGWNNAVDNNTGKTGMFSVTFKPNAALALIENYGAGPEANDTNTGIRQLSDTVLTYTVDKKTSLALNYDYGHDAALTSVTGASGVTWQGIAAYLKYQSNDWFAIAPRSEYTKDKDGFMTGTAQDWVQEFTFTAEFKHKDGVVMRLEYRGDFAKNPYFFTDTSALKKNQQMFMIGWIYAFTTKAS